MVDNIDIHTHDPIGQWEITLWRAENSKSAI